MSKTIFDISRVLNPSGGYVADKFVRSELIKSVKTKEFDSGECAKKATVSITGADLRKEVGEIYYFMPVSFVFTSPDTGVSTSWAFNDAVVSVAAKKKIIETALPGRAGTIKELVGIGDLEIKLTVAVAGDDYPERTIQDFVSLYEKNASIEFICPITDYFLLGGSEATRDKVIILDVDFPAVPGNEDMQLISVNMIRDGSLELKHLE